MSNFRERVNRIINKTPTWVFSVLLLPFVVAVGFCIFILFFLIGGIPFVVGEWLVGKIGEGWTIALMILAWPLFYIIIILIGVIDERRRKRFD